ncbi:hypothetical protein HYH02_013619 [Chlamydomonas schloesseri]|uniref:Uncharacterized protein n=1 Tax=Chlamydomonas schloesseri TaxID=2026947 RepID=A0A835VWT6_9CHLO|nr:hypothetical protein HYH02_013619 [Chlamydomonas schloesseri]|eukprot:KAG2430780.1 hypothetical protein HYH02_013619 [Chlamydomonas schloesseri]
MASMEALLETGVAGPVGEPGEKDLLAAATAFFKWRQAALKANFRRELEGILEEVAQDEETSQRLQKQLQRTQERLDEATQAMSKVSNDHRLALVHIDQLRMQNDELFKALEAAEGASRTHAEQARAAKIMHQEEAKRRQEESKQAALELESAKEQNAILVAQQQVLLEQLATRDKEVAESSSEALHHKRNAARLQEEVERLEAIARATGERAAAAEAQAAARNEQINKLYAELNTLRERYHAELSELKAARIGAAEVSRMRERMDSLQGTNDSLVAARDELRASLEGVMAKLTAAEQRLKRQAVAATMREDIIDAITTVGRELTRDSNESHMLQATTRLSSELDLALASNADLAERLTASEAVIAQQQGALRRLTEECAQKELLLRESREHRDEQHRINAELAAELKRLAAEAALGPILVLDKDGNLVPQQSPQPVPPSATAPAVSQLEAQSTAVRVILADKAFGLGALIHAIAAKPGSVQSVRAQLGECRALAEHLRAEVEDVSSLLAERPFEAEELARKLPQLQERLAKTESCMVASREDLSLKQVHAVGLEARVLQAESALRAGSSLLQGWHGLLAEVAAAEDGRLEPDVRLGLREELKTREDALHRALLDLAATAPALLSGDPGYAGAQVAMREASNAMMELALTLGDRMVDAPATRTRVLATEALLLDRAGVLARFREVLAAAPGEIADMVERLTAIIPDVQCMGPAIEEMLRCVQHYLAAGKAESVDVVALQGEVLMLRGLVRTKDLTIQSLEAVGTGIRTGSPTKRALKMVPLEALHAAEAARDAVAGEKAALQTRMVDQRVRLVAARHRLVNYMHSLRIACETAEVFYKWRTAAAVIKAERCYKEMVAAQAEQARVEKEAAEEKARMEAEAEAMRTAHAAEVTSLKAAHEAEVTDLTNKHTAEAAETRVKVLRLVMKEKAARWRELMAYSVMYHWRHRVRRQVEARQRWRKWSDRLRALEEPDNPTYRDILYGPRLTIARRLALRRRDPGDLLTPHARTGADVARVVLKAWRGWAYMKRQMHKVDALTEALPDFIENIGNRRRLERAWLALRLWTAGCATKRAHEAIRDYENAAAEAEAAKTAAESAFMQLRDEQEQAAFAAADAAAQAGGLMAMGQDMGVGPGGGMYGGGGVYGGATEVGTQYLPNVHTVLSAGGTAPAHSGVEDAVAAAAAAGLGVSAVPINSAMQYHTSGVLSDGGGGYMALGAAHGGGTGGVNVATWGDLTNAGGAMPPLAGPSEAALIAQRRITAPGGQSSSDQEELYGRGYGRRGGPSGRLPPAGPHSRRGAGSGRPSGDGTGLNRRSSSGVSAMGGLSERAERLVRAVDAIGAGVADTAALLSPRTKVLQADGLAPELGMATDDLMMERPPPMSPTRRIQTDGTVAIEYLNQTSDGGAVGAVSSPPGSPTRSQPVSGGGAVQTTGGGGGYAPATGPAATMSAPVPAHTSEYLRQPQQSAPAALAQQSAAQARVRSARTSGSGIAAASGVATGANSVQVLLSRLPGRNRPIREEPRPLTRAVPPAWGAGGGAQQQQQQPQGTSRAYAHVGSRLHEETVSTIAKKRLNGGDSERGAANLTRLPTPPLLTAPAAPIGMLLPPRNDVPGPVTTLQVERQTGGVTTLPDGHTVRVFPAADQVPVHAVWPHVPAGSVPGAAVNTSEHMRRRGEEWNEPLPPYVPSAPATLSTPVLTSNAAQELAALLQQQQAGLGAALLPAAKQGKVVRFERMTPPPPGQKGPLVLMAGDGEGATAALEATLAPQPIAGTGGAGPPAPEVAGGPVAYIQLPSPVKVSIRLPGH